MSATVSALGPVALGQTGDLDESFVADTRQHLDRLEKLGMAAVFVLWRDGEWIIEQGCGLADRESGMAWAPEVVSTIGSITKQFTGAAILKLQERGKLSTRDSITKYFDDVSGDKRGITLHHLLTHSSGIQDIPNAGDHTPIDREEFIRRAMSEPLAFEPGSEYRYSNAGYSLLGAVMEIVTGTPYEAWLRENLFLPLGMKDTGYLLPEFSSDRLAKGYRGGERWGTVLERPMADDGPYWVLRANGGIHSTARDMVRWGEALLDGEVLSPESMKLYWTPHIDETNGDGGSFYGYGWVTMELPGGQRLITHNGGNGILGADMMILPDSRTILFVQSNVIAENRAAMRLLEQVGQRVMSGQPYPALPDIKALSPSQSESFAGAYRTEDGRQFEIAVDGSWITATPGDGAAYAALFPSDLSMSSLNTMTDQLERGLMAWAAGDASLLYELYNVDEPMDEWAARRRARLEQAEQSLGTLKRFEVVGSGNSGIDEFVAGTFVRAHFERRTLGRIFLWAAPDRIRGEVQGGSSFWPARLAHVGDGAFSGQYSGAQGRPLAGPLVFTVRSDGSVELALPGGQVARKVTAP